MRIAVVSAALAAALLLIAGCGGHDNEASDEDTYHLLDAPEVGLVEVGEVEPGIPVLCYHYFRRDFAPGYLARAAGAVIFGLPALGDREFWTTSSNEFRKHLQYFRDTGTEVMTLDEVADLVDAGAPLPARAVVLTIDDADRSVYEIAWPLLEEFGVRAHVFVPTIEVGLDWSELAVCSWEELAEMSASGRVLVESHTHDLHFKVKNGRRWDPVFWHPEQVPVERIVDLRLRLADGEGSSPVFADVPVDSLLAGHLGAVAADLLVSRMIIAAEVGRPPRWLAWPYGLADEDLDAVGVAVGFRGAVSLRASFYGPDVSSAHVGRLTLTAKTTVDLIDEALGAAFP